MSKGYIEKSLSIESSDIDKINRFTRTRLDMRVSASTQQERQLLRSEQKQFL